MGTQTGEPISGKRVSRIITRIGKKAGVIVNREMKKVREEITDSKTGEGTGRFHLVEREVVKYASAHDCRRSFGTRWAKRVMPATLKLLMRHASIDTSMAYYVDMGVDEVAADLWAHHRPESETKKAQPGTILGTTGSDQA